MKKFSLLVIVIFLIQSLKAQELIISSFLVDTNDNQALIKPVYDLNDDICALVILNTQGVKTGIDVKGAIVAKNQQEGGKFFLYLPTKTKRITLYHQDYIPLTVRFDELLNTSHGVEGGKTYYLTVNGNDGVTNKKNVNEYNYLFFESNIPLTRLLVDGIEWKLQNESSVSKLVRCGEYHYTASASGYQDISGTVIVVKSIDPMQVSLNFNK